VQIYQLRPSDDAINATWWLILRIHKSQIAKVIYPVLVWSGIILIGKLLIFTPP